MSDKEISYPIVFEKDKFPIIKVYEDSLEIKAVDHWEFRKFPLERITSIEYYNPHDKWYNRILMFNYFELFFNDIEPSLIKINLTNGGDWKYNCPYKKDRELIQFFRCLNVQIKTL